MMMMMMMMMLMMMVVMVMMMMMMKGVSKIDQRGTTKKLGDSQENSCNSKLLKMQALDF